MIARYTNPEMGRIWSDQRKYETWLQVEIAAVEAMARAGIVPADAARDIRERQPHASGDFVVVLADDSEVEVATVFAMYRRHLEDYDLDTVAETFDESIVWHLPGRSSMAATPP